MTSTQDRSSAPGTPDAVPAAPTGRAGGEVQGGPGGPTSAAARARTGAGRRLLARARAARLPRDLHPVAWWVWALGLATAASLTTNPFALLLLVGSAALVVSARHGDQPWSRSFRFYLALGAAIVALRVTFRVLLGGAYATGPVLLDLPSIPLPGFAAGIALLGPVTTSTVLSGLYDGLRLAAIVIAVGAANALANPKRLLRSVPAALYEVGTALVVAVTVLPQLAESVQRVRAAQSLRSGPSGRVRGLRRLLVPVLEDALERSLAMAASMDARGYGRTAGADARSRRRTGALMLTGLVGVCVGVYAVLDQTAPRVLALPMLGVGLLAAVLGLRAAGARVPRTRYRPDRWRWPEVVVALGGLAVGVLAWHTSTHQVALAYPGTDALPGLAPGALVVCVVAVLTGLVAPPPPVTGDDA
ncbi:energy-coupling factor transporter transmembrane component T family protein [Nocardioides bruguierae]|uniref:Energy-coupling factor transporter transmembrane protein EcfT n=1 Tax=Nocardioides bruguierae TaxID=2945102 RepID=A0A9X2IFI2_9ACTN|nr:energy-coupling factor transporter transmembrane component T [Nocardioides bruguierae]MCM0619750.1 energy-coupling factor transporter transmembrane protein EcfT [Nocardioides bruguierae]